MILVYMAATMVAAWNVLKLCAMSTPCDEVQRVSTQAKILQHRAVAAGISFTINRRISISRTSAFCWDDLRKPSKFLSTVPARVRASPMSLAAAISDTR